MTLLARVATPDLAMVAAPRQVTSVQIPLPHDLAETVVRTAAKLIPPRSVYPGEGIEDYPHVTVLYGLETQSADPVIAAVRGVQEFAVTLLRPGLLQSSDLPYDVLMQHISSPELHALHAQLATLPHTMTHPEYIPHLTLGYVQHGTFTPEGVASLLTGLEGTTFEAELLEFCGPEKVRTRIPLGGPETSMLEVEALALTLPAVANHPNRLPFEGILMRVDEPSDKAPGGAQGHRVQVSRAKVEAALPSLIGMAVCMAPTLADHDRRLKVGVITGAEIHGQDVRVVGHLFAKDFPMEVQAIRRDSQGGKLGMSFEITQVAVADPAQPIWHLDSLLFTGAAILRWDKAAYHKTRLLAAKGDTMEADSTVEVAAMQEELDKLAASMDQLVSMRDKIEALCAVMGRLEGMKAMMEDAVNSMSRYAAMAYGMAGTLTPPVTPSPSGTETLPAPVAAGGEMHEVLAALKNLGCEVAAIKGELHTDTPAAPSGLATDGNAGGRGLLTDVKGSQPPPQRKTLQAGTEYEQQKAQFGEKYATESQGTRDPRYLADLQASGLETGRKYTIRDVDLALRQHRPDLSIQERMIFKNRMVEYGQLD